MRHIIYEKGLDNEFDIVSPSQLGGLGSEQYVALNPQNKMPLLLLPNGQSLPESEVGHHKIMHETGWPFTQLVRALDSAASTSRQSCKYRLARVKIQTGVPYDCRSIQPAQA